MESPSNAMHYESEEPDYLALAQLERKTLSFERAVKDAFLLEHDCSENQQIAAVIGRDKSRVAQILKEPERLDATTIENLLDHLARPVHKKRILRAWMKLRFGIDVDGQISSRRIGDVVSARMVDRIRRQMRAGLAEQAAQSASEAFQICDDYNLSEQLLDIGFHGYRKIGALGKAMKLARLVELRGRESGDYNRQATGHYFRALALHSMLDSQPDEINPVIAEIRLLIDRTSGNPKPNDRLERVDDFLLQTLAISVHLTFAERKSQPLNTPDVRKTLGQLNTMLRSKPVRPRRFYLHFLAARSYLLLGETFQAQEQVELAFNFGGGQSLAFKACGHLQGRIMKLTESPAKVSKYLFEVVRTCDMQGDRHHGYSVEYDLARVESSMFPPSRPVV